MVARFGWLYHWSGLGWALGKFRFEQHSAERIRKAAADGPIVYVMLGASTLDHLALNTVLNRRGLPRSAWANGVSSFAWQPFMRAWADVFRRLTATLGSGRAGHAVNSGWLGRLIASGEPATIFLKDRAGRDHGDPATDPLLSVLEADEVTEQHVRLLPVIVLWNRAPETTQNAASRFLLGSREHPGFWGRLASVYLPGTTPLVQVGEPVDLTTLRDRVRDGTQLGTLRTLLRRYLKRETNVVRGPTLLPRTVLQDMVLDNPPMQQFATDHAKETGRTVTDIRSEMAKEYRSIAANFHFGTIVFLSWALKPLWTRVFDGYDIREEDLERLREAMRNGTAVIIPCHRSHFDYLLLSWMFYYEDLVVPHVVAGINLAIWPVSLLLRACGGFFIKRSFAGEKVHSNVFSRYLGELLRLGYPVEFYIEGGRTRTGKLLRPRVGVLGMVMDAAARQEAQNITLLPVSITYEEVAEGGAYAHELGGADKQRETVGQLFKARSVLRHRFGRVFVRIGEPMQAQGATAEAESRQDAQWASFSPEVRHDELTRVGEQIIHRIGSVTVVLPTTLVSAALLCHSRQGLQHEVLLARVDRLLTFLKDQDAQIADSLERPEAAVQRALDRLVRRGLVELHEVEGARYWRAIPRRRVQLDTYKNQVMHLLAPAGLVAALWFAGRARHRDFDSLRAPYAWLEQVLHREFIQDPETSSDERLRRALDQLVAYGALNVHEGGWTLADSALLDEIYGLMASLLEAYAWVARQAPTLETVPEADANFAKRLIRDTSWEADHCPIQRPEALSSVTLRNAAKTLLDQGLVQRQDGKLCAPHPDLGAFSARLAATVQFS